MELWRTHGRNVCSWPVQGTGEEMLPQASFPEWALGLAWPRGQRERTLLESDPEERLCALRTGRESLLCRLWRGAAESKYTKRSAQYWARRRKGHQGQPSPQALTTCKGLGHHVRSNSKYQWRSVPESLVDSTPVLLQVVRAGCGLTALYPAPPALWLVLLKPAINSCWRLSLR